MQFRKVTRHFKCCLKKKFPLKIPARENLRERYIKSSEIALKTQCLRGFRFQIREKIFFIVKTPLTSEPPWVGLNGVFAIFLDFMRFFGVLTDALGLDT